MRQHNRELKQQLQQQDELQETISNLNQEVGDLRLRLSHSHARGGTETSAFGAGDAGLGGGVGGMTTRAKRSLATELGEGLDDEDEEEEQDAAAGGREEHVQGEDGMTTIYHTTTVRRVVVSLRVGTSHWYTSCNSANLSSPLCFVATPHDEPTTNKQGRPTRHSRRDPPYRPYHQLHGPFDLSTSVPSHGRCFQPDGRVSQLGRDVAPLYA